MLNFIWNPVAGKGKALHYREVTEKKLKEAGIAYRFWETTQNGDARRIARELCEKGERVLVAAGGDGTIHEVLNGIPDPSKVCLGILPCGSGNDFAAGIGIPRDAEGAIDLLIHGTAKKTDYLVCSNVRCMNVLGTGIDVEVLKYTARCKLLKGSAAYFVSLLRALLHLRFYGLSAKFGNHAAHHDALIVCACNARYFGGGIPICPSAVCDDGKLELVMLENVKPWAVPKELIGLMTGKLLKSRYAFHEFADMLKVELDEPGIIQIDGELYENLPFDVSVVPGGVRIYRP